MKYLFLVWSGIWRKRTRAALILLQVTVAFTLFGVLQGLDTGIRQAINKAHANRMYVLSRVSGGDLLPLGLLPDIKRVPGVVEVSYGSGLGGTYQNPNQQIGANAVEATSFARIYPEIVIPPSQLAALASTRTGAVAGAELMRLYGWKIGQRITIQSPLTQRDGSRDWSFDIVGVFTQPDDPDRTNSLFINYAYLNEAREANRDTLNAFVVQIDDPKRSASIGHDIDALFANSSHETRTQSESDIAASQVQRIGDIDFLAHAVTAAAFFALLFATGALMMQTIRERTPELAVLKTLGFTDRAVFLMVVGESLLICIAAALLGLGLATGVFPYTAKFVPGLSMPLSVVGVGLIGAVLVALITAAPPASRAARLQVVDALAGR